MCGYQNYTKAPSPTGSWDYTITGTPQGDFKGVMIIAEADKMHYCKIDNAMEQIPIDKFITIKKLKKCRVSLITPER
jgi:hypothetical protein